MQGYWNGNDAEFIGVNYIVTKSDFPIWWQNLHVGEIRQGLMITQRREAWLIDNQHGDGYFKVTEGLGWFRHEHKSLEDPAAVTLIPDEEINKIFNRDGLQAENDAHEEWIKVVDPAEYSRMQALKQAILELQSQRS